MEAEIERDGLELRFSRDEIDRAKEKAKADMAQGRMESAQNMLVAASRGSLEASRIINQSGDKQVKAIERMEKATVAGLTRVERAIENNVPGSATQLFTTFNG